MIEVGVAHGDEVCEECGRWFVAGEATYGFVSREYGVDPYGLDPTRSDFDLSTGRTVSNLRCEECFTAEEKGNEHGAHRQTG